MDTHKNIRNCSEEPILKQKEEITRKNILTQKIDIKGKSRKTYDISKIVNCKSISRTELN